MMKIAERLVGTDQPVFVIAEIGQNHQGSLQIAKEMILKAKEIGVDCVKFQKSCLEAKFTRNALQRPYTGVNSWGKTYGEHKLHLEFTLDEYKSLQQFCTQIGILFTASAMDPVSLQQLTELNVPFVKIGSGDADNIPMLRQAAFTNIPLIVSTGMQTWNQVLQITEILKSKDVALLHCISSYPSPPEEVQLNFIPLYKQHFPDLVIGYSGHEAGLQLTAASVLLGARVIERHFTLDKNWKGTDHKASLNPAEFGRLVKYIRTLESIRCQPTAENVISILRETLSNEDFKEEELQLALKSVTADDKRLMHSEFACHSKLGKSLVFMNDLVHDHVLTVDDVAVKVSDPQGLSPVYFDRIIGSTVIRNCRKDEPIRKDDLYMQKYFW